MVECVLNNGGINVKLLLCGGGSGTQTVETNKVFNQIVNHSKPVLYVPLAMDESEHTYDSCLEWINGELSEVDIPSIEMVRTFEELASKNYYDYSFLSDPIIHIYRPGIHTSFVCYDKSPDYAIY